MDFTTAASLGCRFSTAYRAVALQGRVQAGDWVAVHGCGGVGLSAIMIAAALGAKAIAIDIRPESLQLAQEFGAIAIVLAADGVDVPAEIHRLTDRGANVSLDCLGSRATCANSILSLRKRGRHVQVGLLAGRDESPPLPMGRVIAWELEICGSHGLQARHYATLLQLIHEKQLPVERLIHNTITLAEAGDVLMAMDRFNQLGITVIVGAVSFQPSAVSQKLVAIILAES
jgi:alcohol dehydrogenase